MKNIYVLLGVIFNACTEICEDMIYPNEMNPIAAQILDLFSTNLVNAALGNIYQIWMLNNSAIHFSKVDTPCTTENSG